MKSFNIFKVLFYLSVTICWFALSFLIKHVALDNITADFGNPLFEFDYMINTGAAFSTLANSSYILAILAMVIIFGIVCYICYNTYKLSYLKILCLSTLTGGIAANLFERIVYGHVVDYIKVKPFLFPVFNFQDVLIVVSCSILVLMFQFSPKKETTEIPSDAAAETEPDSEVPEENNQEVNE